MSQTQHVEKMSSEAAGFLGCVGVVICTLLAAPLFSLVAHSLAPEEWFDHFEPSFLDRYVHYYYEAIYLIVLLPLFPAGIASSVELTGYPNLDGLLVMGIGLLFGLIYPITLYAYYVIVRTYRVRWRRHILWLTVLFFTPSIIHYFWKAIPYWFSSYSEWLFRT